MPHRDIIVIGGSAGAMAALRRILVDLPVDLGASLFVAIHTPPQSIHQPDVLRMSSPLPVELADDGMAIVPGCLYVARPDHHLLLMPDAIHLGRGPRENMSRPAIDPLFRSAAASFSRVVAVLLSGLLNDGVSGLDAVRRCGGVTIVQRPEDAGSPDLPGAAIAAGVADHSVAAAEIGGLLCRLAAEAAGPPVPAPADIRVELLIAEGRRPEPPEVAKIARPSTLTCPHCSGVLSEIEVGPPLRFRCQVGHGFTAENLLETREGAIDEALHAGTGRLVERIARDARSTGRSGIADLYETRAEEYKRHAGTIRQAVLPLSTEATGLPAARGRILCAHAA